MKRTEIKPGELFYYIQLESEGVVVKESILPLQCFDFTESWKVSGNWFNTLAQAEKAAMLIGNILRDGLHPATLKEQISEKQWTELMAEVKAHNTDYYIWHTGDNSSNYLLHFRKIVKLNHKDSLFETSRPVLNIEDMRQVLQERDLLPKPEQGVKPSAPLGDSPFILDPYNPNFYRPVELHELVEGLHCQVVESNIRPLQWLPVTLNDSMIKAMLRDWDQARQWIRIKKSGMRVGTYDKPYFT